MFRVVCFLAFFMMVRAQLLHQGHYGVVPYTHAHPLDGSPKPYQFSYHAEAIGGSSSRQETGDGSGSVVGSYTLNDVDGRNRLVEYVADQAGFRASVKTNEPGTKNESPADVAMYSSAPDAPAHVGPTTYTAPHYRYGANPYHYAAHGSQPYGGRYGHHSGLYGRHGHGAYPYGHHGYY